MTILTYEHKVDSGKGISFVGGNIISGGTTRRGGRSLSSARGKKNDFVRREELPGNHYMREGANVPFFFAGNANGRRGWAAAVALTRVAQLGNRGEQTSRRRR